MQSQACCGHGELGLSEHGVEGIGADSGAQGTMRAGGVLTVCLHRRGPGRCPVGGHLSKELRNSPWTWWTAPKGSADADETIPHTSTVGAGGHEARQPMLIQPQDHTPFSNMTSLVGSRNIWQEPGWGKATVAQAPAAASMTPPPTPSPPLNSFCVTWLVTHQAPSASDQERAAVVYPGGLDGGPVQEGDHGHHSIYAPGAQESQWKCLRDRQVG